MTKTIVPAAPAADERDVASAPPVALDATSPAAGDPPPPSPPPASAEPTEDPDPDEHVLVLSDLVEVGATAGRIIRGAASAIARLPAEAVRPATADEISLAAPRFIVLED